MNNKKQATAIVLRISSTKMIFYSLPALIVFLTCYDALLKDATTPNDSVEIWVFMGVAALIWPLTLPCILRKKIANWHAMYKAKASHA